jgi:hypothetical protein
MDNSLVEWGGVRRVECLILELCLVTYRNLSLLYVNARFAIEHQQIPKSSLPSQVESSFVARTSLLVLVHAQLQLVQAFGILLARTQRRVINGVHLRVGMMCWRSTLACKAVVSIENYWQGCNRHILHL